MKVKGESDLHCSAEKRVKTTLKNEIQIRTYVAPCKKKTIIGENTGEEHLGGVHRSLLVRHHCQTK